MNCSESSLQYALCICSLQSSLQKVWKLLAIKFLTCMNGFISSDAISLQFEIMNIRRYLIFYSLRRTSKLRNCIFRKTIASKLFHRICNWKRIWPRRGEDDKPSDKRTMFTLLALPQDRRIWKITLLISNFLNSYSLMVNPFFASIIIILILNKRWLL